MSSMSTDVTEPGRPEVQGVAAGVCACIEREGERRSVPPGP